MGVLIGLRREYGRGSCSLWACLALVIRNFDLSFCFFIFRWFLVVLIFPMNSPTESTSILSRGRMAAEIASVFPSCAKSRVVLSFTEMSTSGGG